MDIYQAVIRPVLFTRLKTDPEWLHQQTLRMLGWVDQHHSQPFSKWIQTSLQHSYCLTHPHLRQTLWGLNFANPIGLAAGFDKDGVAAGIWSGFGFGFAELGTVTLHPQPGNPRPRLFRLPQDQAVLNRMGFNNQGAAVMAERLSRRGVGCGVWGVEEIKAEGRGQKAEGGEDTEMSSIQNSNFKFQNSKLSPTPQTPHPRPHTPHPTPLPLGINLGKSKITPLEEAAADYLGSFRLLKHLGDYFVVNVSSPNTPGLRSLQATDQLDPILTALQQENQQQKPLLIKIAPDLEWEAIAAVLDLAKKHHLAGIIATNTTIRREGLTTQVLESTGNSVQAEAGGISGAPLRDRSTEVIRFIWKETQGTLPIIGVGGIFTAEDAWEKITAGASLIQVYTGWIYEGPWMVRRILQGLVQKLEERGLGSISAAIGLGDGE
ncbi:quinone-dependent dihydroorotate dehydrogenase [Kovacikia minuta CCNUW1]|uniref:quinone-dependent dihydroorotate dehydrogenase n=1 Tax=Kovacikia minuta TaxID=2931930 RepID=UPI001CCB7549|nr:quinone-dependent dihydroorotate dehydrogenase [Kovacikia minuta]UBF24124.1 quinone-dependent dihydroorotate dehydrogenase [Kovacikia minuta CCNUW1]